MFGYNSVVYVFCSLICGLFLLWCLGVALIVNCGLVFVWLFADCLVADLVKLYLFGNYWLWF